LLEAEGEGESGPFAVEGQTAGERGGWEIPSQQIVQPQAPEPKDALVPPVVPVKAVAVALMHAGCRQMTDPPHPQEEPQQQAL
jgi:hypothetical protein